VRRSRPRGVEPRKARQPSTHTEVGAPMAKSRLVAALLAFHAGPAHAAEEQAVLNPIRKVVTLLQSMTKKVEAEGEREKDLYEKFMCYCKTGGGDLSASIGAAGDKIPSVSSDIEATEAKLTGAKATLKQAQSDRTAAKEAMASATALREKEAQTYADFKAEHDTDIAAIAKATAAVSKGVAGSFLQTPAARVLQHVVSKSDIPEADQQAITAFLSQSSDYAPQSGEIIGILKQMGDTMAANLNDATSTEEEAIQTYHGLLKAKKKEVEALTGTIEAKTKQIGELGVAIVRMKEDLADTQATLAEDQAFLANLDKSCSTKTAEWDERSKTRAEELVALADTVKVLNDDDALELFKKTLPAPSASLLQVQAGESARRSRALSAVRVAQQNAIRQDKPRLDLLALALVGKKSMSGAGFEKVVKMIDDMVSLLKKEQVDDEHKKEYCAMQFDVSDDKKKSLERTISGEESAIATAKETIATLAQEISALEAGIKALDKAVAEATEQRKNENAEYKDLMASDTAAKEVLAFAKNRLNKFYNPNLYKPPPKVELSAEDRIYSNQGGEVTTAAPGGIAGTGIAVLAQVSVHQHRAAPPAPPATWGAYASKSEGSTGVIAMIDLLISDLEKEMTEAETDEKDAQGDYEQMMKDSASKRTTDSTALTEKGSAKADTEAELQAHSDSKAAGGKELMATMKYISSLHAECDWLLQYFDARKEARTGEVDSLKKAKDVLSGADYSLLQRRANNFLGH